MCHRFRVQQTRIDACAARHQYVAWRVVQRRRGWRGELPRDRKRAPLRRRDAAVTHLRRMHSHLVRSRATGQGTGLGFVAKA